MKHFKRISAMVMALISLFAIVITASAETNLPSGTYAYTIKGDVAVRRTPSSGDNIITRVNTGTKVYILESTSSSTGYYKVRIDGITSGAYIRADCLGANATGSGITVNKYMYCNVGENSYVNIRSGPGTDYSSIGQLRRGDMVYVVSTDSTWAKINAPINGYVKYSYLQIDNVSGGGDYAHPTSMEQAFGATGIIERGHFNYKVANVQLALGFPDSEIDAIFGAKTHEAVMDFQRKNDLEPDGKVGTKTKAELWRTAETRLRNYGYTTW